MKNVLNSEGIPYPEILNRNEMDRLADVAARRRKSASGGPWRLGTLYFRREIGRIVRTDRQRKQAERKPEE